MYSKAKKIEHTIWNKISTKMLFFVVATTLIVIFGLYAYLVNRTIMNVVSREKTEQDIASLSSSIGELEYKYMAIRSNITIDVAYAKGFQDSIPSQFITRGSHALTYNSR